MDVVFYEVFSEEEKELKKRLSKNIRAEFKEATIQSYPTNTPPAEVICIRTQSIIPDHWQPKLRAIFSRSTGFDHLNRLLLHQKNGLQLGYLPNYCARSVAEHAILTTLALLKKLKKQLFHFNTFNRSGLTGKNAMGRNVLIVGAGKIGSQIAQIAQCFGMHVRAVDIVQNHSFLEYISLEKGLKISDVVICALPLTNETRGMLDYKTLSTLSKGSLFINISRGEISPLADLEKLLEEGILSGLALDVYEEESKLAAFLESGIEAATDSFKRIMRLKDRENVIFTPHNAFNSLDDLEKKAELSCLALKMFSETGKFPEASA